MKYILLSFMFLAGCNAAPAWTNAATTHVCTGDEMVKAEHETNFCMAATSYGSNYCYQTAIMRNCNALDIAGNPIKKPTE